MNKELLTVADMLAGEKGVPKFLVLQAIQAALESATRKLTDKDIDVRVQLDSRTGDYETFRYWEVVEAEALEFPERQLTLEEARKRVPTIEIGGRIEELMPSIAFGRIAAQTAIEGISSSI